MKTRAGGKLRRKSEGLAGLACLLLGLGVGLSRKGEVMQGRIFRGTQESWGLGLGRLLGPRQASVWGRGVFVSLSL